MACKPCTYLRNVLRWIDQGGNVLLGGDPRHTISARLGRAELAGSRPATVACRFLGFITFEADHCVDAARSESPSSELWRWDKVKAERALAAAQAKADAP